jgi:riboflavin kinase / FMN adenylyltransferase
VKVAREISGLERVPRAVAIGSFDGVHLGHRRVLQAVAESGLRRTVVTFDPHPRTVLGHRVDLLATVQRRLELLAHAGVEETLVIEFTPELAEREPEEFADLLLRPIGAEVVVEGENFRFGHARRGDLALLQRLGFDVRAVPMLGSVSSTLIRQLVRAAEIEEAAGLLGRPPEVEGVVVSGDARGGTLGFPTANLRVDPQLLVPAYGIYAGETLGHRAAVSIGVNPHYGGTERRVEAFLLDFEGDLYGTRLVVELWERLREERAFEDEAALVAQIGDDVERTRRARRPAVV